MIAWILSLLWPAKKPTRGCPGWCVGMDSERDGGVMIWLRVEDGRVKAMHLANLTRREWPHIDGRN